MLKICEVMLTKEFIKMQNERFKEKYETFDSSNTYDMEEFKQQYETLDLSNAHDVEQFNDYNVLFNLYRALFLTQGCYCSPTLVVCFDDLSMVDFFIKNVPVNFLYQSVPVSDLNGNLPIINYAAEYNLEIIPTMLKILSQSVRSDVVIHKDIIGRLESNKGMYEISGRDFSELYSDVVNALEEYCSKSDNGDYRVEPYYLLCIKDTHEEFKQYFRNIAFAIESNGLNQVQSNLIKATETLGNNSEIDINKVNEVLAYLARKAEFNREIARVISYCQADITYSKLEKRVGIDNPESELEGCTSESLITRAVGPKI